LASLPWHDQQVFSWKSVAPSGAAMAEPAASAAMARKTTDFMGLPSVIWWEAKITQLPTQV
jgi:hypothetical protein